MTESLKQLKLMADQAELAREYAARLATLARKLEDRVLVAIADSDFNRDHMIKSTDHIVTVMCFSDVRCPANPVTPCRPTYRNCKKCWADFLNLD